ncbi:F0F1 ATP synthase subunit gamma [Gemmobacter nectariphilus]|uniref:F0F1 ATP synthase subunit gamma n=1 Tax=Gemmobacter nectariphilus TaxID=220343 RepID=UPI00041A62D7|nr:FoF1 ATP synthase subunit gamma [Gemmobacter nectariphilus]
MTQRPEDIQRRLSGIEDLTEVVGALRAIASGHVAGARGALAAILAYESQVGAALDRLAVAGPVAAEGPGLVVVIGAAQGFCGGYPARVAEAAQALAPGAGVLVVGQRTVAMLDGVGLTVLFTADLPASPAQVPDLASRLTDRLLAEAPRFPGPIRTLSGQDSPGQPVQLRRIWPPDPSDQPQAVAAPLTTLPRAGLVEALLAERLFATLARTVMEGLRAENQARVEAMARASSNLKDRRAEMQHLFRQARQEQMTTELIELTAGQEPLA